MAKGNDELLRYPIGKFVISEQIDEALIIQWIEDIEHLPKTITELTKDITVNQLQWPYRPGGWNIKQVVHHLADSHMNSIIRFKLALTEDTPTIRPYMEDRWATLVDGADDYLGDSLLLLTGLHAKLGKLLRSMSNDQLSKIFIHPEHGRQCRLDDTIGLYAWHSNHHVAHIKQALKHKGRF